MKWMHFEVFFSQFTSFSIGFTIESVQSDLSFCSEIAFQQGFIRFLDETQGRFYANYWFSIGFTMNPVHPHVIFLAEITFSQCFVRVLDTTKWYSGNAPSLFFAKCCFSIGFTIESALYSEHFFGPWRSIFGHFRSTFGHFGASGPISGPEFFQRPSLRVGPAQPKVNFLNIGPPRPGPQSG